MNRRSFLQWLGLAPVALTVKPNTANTAPLPDYPPLLNALREMAMDETQPLKVRVQAMHTLNRAVGLVPRYVDEDRVLRLIRRKM